MNIYKICEYYGIQNYTINPDGSIDVNGNVWLFNKNLTKLPLKFNKVSGNFSCSDNKNNLTSLDGCPNYVGGDFYCHNNEITSLEGCPNYVGGDFYCHNNEITSLEGCPKEIGGNFHCYSNPLPQEIIDNPKAELLRLQRENKLNILLDEY
jgi:hypothetical protein